MTEILGVVAVVLLALVLALQVAALLRRQGPQVAELDGRLAAIDRALREELARGRAESGGQSHNLRTEIASSLQGASDGLARSMQEVTALQREHLDGLAGQIRHLTGAHESKAEGLRETLERSLARLQEENSRKLDEMRHTVDEKLQTTLERRIGESFKMVSERLEQVHKGLGEMQTLALGVGDLKKVLTNVKARGTWGEVQLGNLLEQVLSPEQYAKNVATKPGSSERVEFAVRLPGPGEEGDSPVWLPIDAKFPLEDYLRLVEASERADAEAVEEAGKRLAQRVEACARDIREKYIDPPNTTDFAILFLPYEGLYAEVLRRAGLAEALQQKHRVTVAGPTTLAACLNSLQMGFRTLTIQKRSSEVWRVLGAVKTEFARLTEIIGKVQKKLQEASNAIDSTATRTRAIEKHLRDVQELPAADTRLLLGPAPEPEAVCPPGETT